MKAQSVRRALTVSCAVLGLGHVGVGAYWFLQVRPAMAAPAKPPPWVDKSYAKYQEEKRGSQPMSIWPVQLEELKKHITRPDLMSKESGIGVWEYVGPLPPAPRAPEKPVEATKLPTGIESLGKLDSLVGLSADGLHGAYLWLYSPPGAAKPKRFWFMIGEFIHEIDTDPKSAKGRFKVTKVSKPNEKAFTYMMTYDVYDDPTKDPVETGKTATFNLFSEAPRGFSRDPVKPNADGTPGKPPVPNAGPGTTPAPVAFLPKVVASSDNSRNVTIEDMETFRYFTETGIEKMIAEVKTEEAKDKAGQPIGVRLVSGITKESDLGKFDVQAGDILKSINGQPTHTRSQAIDVVKKLPKDTASVTAVVERNGRDIVYTVDPRDPEVRKAAGRLKTK